MEHEFEDGRRRKSQVGRELIRRTIDNSRQEGKCIPLAGGWQAGEPIQIIQIKFSQRLREKSHRDCPVYVGHEGSWLVSSDADRPYYPPRRMCHSPLPLHLSSLREQYTLPEAAQL